MNRVIIGDIHSCADELQQIINHFPDCEYIAVGDLFDRGLRGCDVWDLIHEYDIKCCLGNHELKLLNFLTGKRDWISAHYHIFLNQFLAQRGKKEDLISFIQKLPLIIKLDDKSLVTHGGIDILNPWREDVSANVYGKFNPEKPMPKGDVKNGWWNFYKGEVKVYYGHISFDEPRVLGNSVGLDTAACHGNKLTAICHETGEIFSVKSKSDYFKNLNDILSKH